MLIAPLALLFALADGPAAPADPPTPTAASDAAAAAPGAEDTTRGVDPIVVDTAIGSTAQGGGSNAKPAGLRFVWKEHPSLRAGEWLRLDFGVKIHGDRMNPGDDPADFDRTQLTRARIGVDGEIFKVLQFSIEREMTENGDVKLNAKSTKTAWRNLYGELKIADALQIRGGRFKIPFSLDQQTGISNNDFIYRSLGATYLAPARDTGGMVHGRFFGRDLTYAVGLFEHDGDNSRATKIAGGDRTFAARVTARLLKPIRFLNLDDAEFGGNFATTDVTDDSELPNGLRGRTVISEYNFFDPVFVRGTRNRYGADFDWSDHQLGARAEYIAVTDAREGQGLRGDDLNAARAQAYYLQGTWLITGDRKDRPVEPERPLPTKGVGAIELAVRIERLWFDSKDTGEPAFSNSRAEVILPTGNKVFTAGVNWYLNRWMKLQFNAIHQEVEDAGRTPLADGGTKWWGTVFRAQLAL
ncbi:MAG: porin [Vicinamibacterales bacterium]